MKPGSTTHLQTRIEDCARLVPAGYLPVPACNTSRQIQPTYQAMTTGTRNRFVKDSCDVHTLHERAFEYIFVPRSHCPIPDASNGCESHASHFHAPEYFPQPLALELRAAVKKRNVAHHARLNSRTGVQAFASSAKFREQVMPGWASAMTARKINTAEEQAGQIPGTCVIDPCIPWAAVSPMT